MAMENYPALSDFKPPLPVLIIELPTLVEQKSKQTLFIA